MALNLVRRLIGGGGGVISIWRQRQQEESRPIRNAVAAAGARLFGDDQGNKGILQSTGMVGGLGVMLTGLSILLGVDLGGAGITDLDGSESVSIGERLAGGVVVAFGWLAYAGRNKAARPIAGSTVAREPRD